MQKSTIIKILDKQRKILETKKEKAMSNNDAKFANQCQFEIDAIRQAIKYVRYGKERM